MNAVTEDSRNDSRIDAMRVRVVVPFIVMYHHRVGVYCVTIALCSGDFSVGKIFYTCFDIQI